MERGLNYGERERGQSYGEMTNLWRERGDKLMEREREREREDKRMER